MEKILSVIVPSYNMEAYLPKCLGSLIIDDNELLQKLDVIVVNDGSKDRTSEIAHEFESRHPEVFRVIDKPNGNYGSCINAALSKVIGKYVRILDADDCFELAAVCDYLRYLGSVDADMVLSDTENIDDKTGDCISKINYKYSQGVTLPIEVVLKDNMYLNMNTIAYRAAIFNDFSYSQTEGISYTDTQWSIVPLALVKTVLYFPRTVYKYAMNRDGQTMEKATVIKNYWMMVRAALDTTKLYVAYRENLSGEHLALMDYRVSGFAAMAYAYCTTSPYAKESRIDLYAYDDELKEISPQFYEIVGNFAGTRRIKFCYVANWRSHTLYGRFKLKLFAFYLGAERLVGKLFSAYRVIKEKLCRMCNLFRRNFRIKGCMTCNGILKIGRPRLENLGNGWTRLVSDVDIGGELKQVWLAVEDKYAQYLCHERSDAFLVGLFPIASRRHLNIECEAPVNEYLLFQLRSFLIPLISKYGRSVWPVSVKAEVDFSTMPNAGGVGTGISCGIDSLHSFLNHMSPAYKDLKLTHLVLNNVGAFGENNGEIKKQFAWTIEHAKRFCVEYGYEFVVLNSNLFEGMGLDFENNSTYMNMFPILAMQKLWRTFIYASSGYDFQEAYTLINNDDRDPCHYDMLLLDCVSNPSLKIYNEGAPYSRYEKTKHLIDFEPAQKYLQVCIDGSGGNCGKCTKCRRTLLTLDALGALDKFGKVFDIEYYKRNRGEYLRHLYRMHLTPGDHMLGEVYDIMKKDISLGCRILGAWDYYCDICLCCVKDALRPTFKKLGLLKRK